MFKKYLVCLAGGAGLMATMFSAVATASPINSDQALKANSVFATREGNKLTLEQDSAITLRLDQFVSSQINRPGDRIRFLVDKAVVARGFVVVPRGARAYGVINEITPAKGWGRGGKLVMDLSYVEAYDGTKVPLMTTMRGVKGQDMGKTGAFAAGLLLAPVSLLVAPAGAGIKGKKIELAEGQIFQTFVKEDVMWKLKGHGKTAKLPGQKGTSQMGAGAMDDNLQGECMTDICSEYQGQMFRTCMNKCQAN